MSQITPFVPLVLCRPQGGLNDMLNQIERCCRYAEKTGRHVIVDTAYPRSFTFNDALTEYVISRQAGLSLALNPDRLQGRSVAPAFLQGRIMEYDLRPKRRGHPLSEAETGLPLTFDFSQRHPQDILLHQDYGGGALGVFALMRLRLGEALRERLRDRLRRIGGPYLGVHVRHTDYESDFEPLLARVRDMRPDAVVLTTDSAQVLARAREVLSDLPLHHFATDLSATGSPLHESRDLPLEVRRRRNSEAFLDLLTLAYARYVLSADVVSLKGVKVPFNTSGFSDLARKLNELRPIRDGFTGLVGPGLGALTAV